jgi:hypothetical protein
MTTFFLDLWQDLREKRLWPVAVGLALAIVAVPVALVQPASSPTPSAGPATQPQAARLPAVSLDQSSVGNSHLNVFKERNPFKGLAENTTLGVGTPSSTLPSTGGTTGSGGSGSSSSGGGTGSSASSSSGGGGGSSGGGSGGGSSSSSVGPDGKPASPGLHYYIFTADVKFGQTGHVHTYNGIKQLDLLPPNKSPVVAFMGVKNGKSAVFFIDDPAITAAGEGKCVGHGCHFIQMKPGQEETLSASSGSSAVSWTLKVLAVHVRQVSKNQFMGNAKPEKAGAKVSASSNKQQPTLLTEPGLALKR